MFFQILHASCYRNIERLLFSVFKMFQHEAIGLLFRKFVSNWKMHSVQYKDVEEILFFYSSWNFYCNRKLFFEPQHLRIYYLEGFWEAIWSGLGECFVFGRVWWKFEQYWGTLMLFLCRCVNCKYITLAHLDIFCKYLTLCSRGLCLLNVAKWVCCLM